MWKTEDIVANGVKLHVQRAGEGQPILLVMGLGSQLTLWPESFCRYLVDNGFEVIRFDNRDIGLSGSVNNRVRFNMIRDMMKSHAFIPIKANYTLHDMADDTVALIDALGFDKVHIVGASMGGMIAQLTAGKFPEKVSTLTSIMSTTNHPWLPKPKAKLMWRLSGAGPKDNSRAGVIKRGIELWQTIGSPAYPTDVNRIEEQVASDYDRAFRPAGIMRQTHAIVATGSLEKWVKKIQAPTLVVHGDKDPLVRPSGGKRSAKVNPNARLEIIPGMAHDFPDALMARIGRLITSHVTQS